jgi:leucyl-tRNA synthetase
MSKSKGNVIPIATVPEIFSADLVRLFLVSIADLSSAVDWRDKEVETVKKRLMRFWHAMKNDVESGIPEFDQRLSFASKWILAATNEMISKTSEAAHQFAYRKYVTEAFFEQLNRVEEYKSMISDGDERRRVLSEVIDKWLRVLAPVIPHVAEELWSRMDKRGYISLAAFPPYDSRYSETLAQKGFIDSVLDDISSIQAAIKRDIQSIYIYLATPWKYELYEAARSLDDPSIKNVIAQAKEHPSLRKHLKEIAQMAPGIAQAFAQPVASDKALSFEAESEALLAVKEYLARKFEKNVYIEVEGSGAYDPGNRAKRALPAKPAIYVE